MHLVQDNQDNDVINYTVFIRTRKNLQVIIVVSLKGDVAGVFAFMGGVGNIQDCTRADEYILKYRLLA